MIDRPTEVRRRPVPAVMASVGVLGLVITVLVVVGCRSTTTSEPSPGARPNARESTAVSSPEAAKPTSGDGFESVAIGGGGFVTGMSFSDDGVTRVVRTDVYGGYRWARDRWVLDVGAGALPARDVHPGLGGGVLAVAVAPSDSSIVYMAFDNGVYRSADGARSWSRVLSGVSTAANDNFRTTGPRLTVDPVDPDVVYYGSQLEGLFLTLNGGSSWSRVPAHAVPAGSVIDLDDAASRGEVSLPTDVMDQPPHLASAGVNAIALDRDGPVVDGRSAVVYAASYGHGVYRSVDGGASWSKISPDDISAVGYLRVLDNGDVLVTSHRDPTDLTGAAEVWLFHSGHWSKTGPARGADWRGIAADPTTPGRVALMAPGGELALSQDNGADWATLSRRQSSTGDVPWLAWALDGGATWMSVGEIAFDPVVPGRLWLAEGTGIWYADLGDSPTQVHWLSQTRGIENLVPTGVVVPPGGKPLLTAWDRPVFRSEDPRTYPTHYGPENQFGSAWSIDWAVTDPDYVVADVASHQWPSDPSTSGYSEDGGKTWTPFPSIPLHSTNAVTTFGFGAMAVSAPGNIVWVPAFGKRPEYTLDGGKTWAVVVLPGLSDYSLVDNRPYYVNRQVIAADKATSGTFYLYVLDTGVYRSTDGGRTWALRSDNTPMSHADFGWSATLKAVPSHGGELYLTPGRLAGTVTQPFLHSTDGGKTWSNVRGVTGVTAFGFGRPFPGSSSPALYIAGYVHGRYGVYRSLDDRHSWTHLAEYPGGRTAPIIAMDGDKTIAGRVYLAVEGNGWIYRGSATEDQ